MTTATTLDQLYREHNAQILARLTRFTRGLGEIADDALANVWAQLAATPRELAPETAAFYIYVSARHEAVRMLKKAGRTIPVDDVTVYSDVQDRDPVHELVVSRDRVSELLSMLGADSPLKLSQRQALGARIVGLSYDEAGEQLDRSFTWMNRHTSEGRKAAATASRYTEA